MKAVGKRHEIAGVAALLLGLLVLGIGYLFPVDEHEFWAVYGEGLITAGWMISMLSVMWIILAALCRRTAVFEVSKSMDGSDFLLQTLLILAATIVIAALVITRLPETPEEELAKLEIQERAKIVKQETNFRVFVGVGISLAGLILLSFPFRSFFSAKQLPSQSKRTAGK